MNDDRVAEYDKGELLGILGDNRYHSPEDSETGDEGESGRRAINVYNPSWRSQEVRYFLLYLLLFSLKVFNQYHIL